MDVNHGLLENLETFLKREYSDEIVRLDQTDNEAVWVDFADIYAFDPDLADDFRVFPSRVLGHFKEALGMVDLPIDKDFSGYPVRVYNLNEEHIYAPGEIRKEQGGNFVGVYGTLERVTTTSDLPNVLSFECNRCDRFTTVEQPPTTGEIQEPYECDHCDRQGPFNIAENRSEWSDYAKLRLESRPDASEDSEGKIEGYVLDDLIDEGGEAGLIGRAGEPVTVYGTVERVQKQGRGENNLLFDHVLKVNSIEFDRDNETVDVEKHRDEFEDLADRTDAVDLFAESIAPQLHVTDGWEAAMEFAVAYLFGAPRIDIDQGPTYRGDLHFLIITDFGMGKSTFKEDIEAYSPKCISKSTTALSSGVGLTAAAVKDDFGEGQWTIKPGLLVRANSGHLILDEIDKGPDELTDMNDALEGEQVVDIEKAGKSATYDSKTALMALGNPIDGRFNPHESIADQLGISETLLSRFDGIVTMEDHPDEEQDEKIAATYGKSYTEAQQAEYGNRERFETLERKVGVDVGQAWIKHAREQVNPILRYEQFKTLKDWYANEVRTLNDTFSADGEGEDMPVPATVRVLGAAVKMSIAFARVHLRDEVTDQDIERAKNLGKRLVKQNWNGETFDVTKDMSQQERVGAISKAIKYATEPIGKEEIIDQTGIEESRVENRLDKLLQKGVVTEPQTGKYRWV